MTYAGKRASEEFQKRILLPTPPTPCLIDGNRPPPCSPVRHIVICLTPTKNESWILERFIKCASAWANRVVVADQDSSDDSREIVRRHPAATLVENPASNYDEGARQRLLID